MPLRHCLYVKARAQAVRQLLRWASWECWQNLEDLSSGHQLADAFYHSSMGRRIGRTYRLRDIRPADRRSFRSWSRLRYRGPSAGDRLRTWRPAGPCCGHTVLSWTPTRPYQAGLLPPARTSTTDSAIAERSARRSVPVEILANKSRVSLSSTFSICHVLFGYLHSFVYTHRFSRLNQVVLVYIIASTYEHAMLHVTYMPCVWSTLPCYLCQLGHKCYQQSSTNTEAVNDSPIGLPRIPPPANRHGCKQPWRIDTNFRR